MARKKAVKRKKRAVRRGKVGAKLRGMGKAARKRRTPITRPGRGGKP